MLFYLTVISVIIAIPVYFLSRYVSGKFYPDVKHFTLVPVAVAITGPSVLIFVGWLGYYGLLLILVSAIPFYFFITFILNKIYPDKKKGIKSIAVCSAILGGPISSVLLMHVRDYSEKEYLHITFVLLTISVYVLLKAIVNKLYPGRKKSVMCIAIISVILGGPISILFQYALPTYKYISHQEKYKDMELILMDMLSVLATISTYFLSRFILNKLWPNSKKRMKYIAIVLAVIINSITYTPVIILKRHIDSWKKNKLDFRKRSSSGGTCHDTRKYCLRGEFLTLDGCLRQWHID